MNNISIYGRLSKDPEMREFTKKDGEIGKTCSFSVAVNRGFGEETDFFNCRIFGKRAEVLDKYFSKGNRIAVTGEMQCQQYTDKDGFKKYPWILLVRDFDFVETTKEYGASSTSARPDDFEQLNEDVPF